ncbi:MAG: hypothetical protein GXP55_16525 [Deltaproteobacteria bacterium]|nr:hypothetical protein [Deltaproteobacteria bacterium]
MTKSKRGHGVDREQRPGKSSSPFAALAGMRAELPKQKLARPKNAKAPAAQNATRTTPHGAGNPKRAARSSVASTGGYSHEDRVAFSQAFAGVKPLAKKAILRPSTVSSEPVTTDETAQETSARARLDALVGGGVRFDLQRQDGQLRALRQGMHADHLKALLDPELQPDLEFDLHGLTAATAQQRLSRFVREAHGRGARTLLIIHGRGHHSPGDPVLGDAALEALTRGGAAPLVSALATAPSQLGGSGALLVRLGER